MKYIYKIGFGVLIFGFVVSLLGAGIIRASATKSASVAKVDNAATNASAATQNSPTKKP